MSLFDLMAILLALTAVFSWINHRLGWLPHTIGLLVMTLGASFLLIGVEVAFPEVLNFDDISDVVRQLHFQDTVLNGMLAFLLFAGALHVDPSGLRGHAWSIGTMATVGVILSTLIVGVGFWGATRLVGMDVSLAWALVFGALISPTDPVAVLATLKEVKIPRDLESIMTGETLFNDGVGVVLFSVLLTAAVGGGIEPLEVAEMFVVEAIGGAILGGITGYIAYRAMRAIDDYPIEVMISLALVTGTYAVASHLGLSGPIAVVIAGILIGTRGPHDALSDQTQQYLFGFWTLVDQILNSLLFLMIGLEVLILRYAPEYALLGAMAIPLALLARVCAIGLPVAIIQRFQSFARGTVPVLTWAGLRGGISVALAMSIPEVSEKSPILAATYAVVLFTLIVQGLTLRRLILWILR
ncbi:sodium:proton antiporter [Falsirhodobacter sp. alg1]|uniref:cation:proton antiporter n=1 Tax=Falsirhodobacter sp. alg1 TaxID=1472418 RepID=UPI0005EEEACD|nr:sodium:proton antiporter [Falsirhodobacter sp. alg1]